MAGIFKAYDIRGIYGDDLTEDVAYKIGKAFVTFLKCKKVVVGMDMRPHSTPLFEQLAKGITELGADVINVGVCSTPMSYYANGTLGADASIMITASHNAGEWNGFKLCREQAIPISGATGIMDLEQIINDNAFDAPAETPGSISEAEIIKPYADYIQSLVSLPRKVKVAVDFANAMGIYEHVATEGLLETVPLFDELDGTFPNHEANPLKLDTLEDLQALVRESGAEFGVAYDGDADRAGFVDDKGDVVPMDIITALIGQSMLQDEKGVVFYDLRSSWSVKEVIEENGGTPMMSRVGHAFIKAQMRDNDAIFAGELSGHYYFQANYFAESSSLAALRVAQIVADSGKPLSELVKPIQRYFASGEINSEVADPKAVLDGMKTRFTDATITELDGVTVEYDDWWFNVRMSNTEPLVRLNLEAKNEDLMATKRDEILELIRN